MAVALGILEFVRLGQLDRGETKSLYLQHWEAAVYEIVGRWGVLLLCCLLGTFCAGYGMYEFAKERRAPRV